MSAPAIRKRGDGAIIVALICAEFTAAFELTMIYASLKTFFALFDDPLLVGWLVTGYLLVSAAAAAICSKLGDVFGRKRVLILVLLGALAGSLISFFATSLPMIVTGRAVQGLAGAILPLCYGLAREALPEHRVPYGVSAIGSTAVLAAGMGILLGGIIVEHIGWQAIFAASAIFAILSIAMVHFAVPPSKSVYHGQKLGLFGGMMFVPAIFAILLAVSVGQARGWTYFVVPLLGVSGLLLGAAWVWYELRSSHPLINLRLLRSRPLIVGNLAMALYGLGPLQVQVHTLVLQQPTWTGIGLGLSPTMAGLYMMPGQITSFLSAPLAGWIYTRIGERRAMFSSCTLLLIGWILILLFPTNLLIVVISGPIMAFGTVLYYSTVPNIIVHYAPASNTAEISGIAQVMRSTSQAIGAAIVATILASATLAAPEGNGAFPAAEAVNGALIFIVIISAALVLLGFLLPRRNSVVQVPPPPSSPKAPSSIGETRT